MEENGKEVTNSSELSNKFRTEPQNLPEQLILQEAQSGQGYEIMKGQIADPEFIGMQKMEHTHLILNSRIIIHFWQNPETGDSFNLKFKNK